MNEGCAELTSSLHKALRDYTRAHQQGRSTSITRQRKGCGRGRPAAKGRARALAELALRKRGGRLAATE